MNEENQLSLFGFKACGSWCTMRFLQCKKKCGVTQKRLKNAILQDTLFIDDCCISTWVCGELNPGQY